MPQILLKPRAKISNGLFVFSAYNFKLLEDVDNTMPFTFAHWISCLSQRQIN